MRQVEATTTQPARRAVTAAAPADGVLANPWLASAVPGFAVARMAMHAKATCRPPEAPT